MNGLTLALLFALAAPHLFKGLGNDWQNIKRIIRTWMSSIT
jgi:hypothetical protein